MFSVMFIIGGFRGISEFSCVLVIYSGKGGLGILEMMRLIGVRLCDSLLVVQVWVVSCSRFGGVVLVSFMIWCVEGVLVIFLVLRVFLWMVVRCLVGFLIWVVSDVVIELIWFLMLVFVFLLWVEIGICVINGLVGSLLCFCRYCWVVLVISVKMMLLSLMLNVFLIVLVLVSLMCVLVICWCGDIGVLNCVLGVLKYCVGLLVIFNVVIC